MSLPSLTDDQQKRLNWYLAELLKWQKKINLISRNTTADAWHRHFEDSLQLVPLLPEKAKILIDFGSGAGFPAMVLAYVTDLEIHVIESDARKCAFLTHVSRETQGKVIVHNKRIEAVPAFEADLITSRAMASLEKLLDFASPFISRETQMIFPKGKTAQDELTCAEKCWNMQVERFPSLTDSEATIFRLSNLEKKQ